MSVAVDEAGDARPCRGRPREEAFGEVRVEARARSRVLDAAVADEDGRIVGTRSMSRISVPERAESPRGVASSPIFRM